MSIPDKVRDYYGKTLESNKDLKTSACCSVENIPADHRAILAQIAPEILEKFYGCGSPIPPAIEGCTVLDLGCGAGRDAYLLSALVGEKGRVIGVDMTEAQLEVARRHRESQATRFGFSQSNVDFHHGFIEDLAALGGADESVDVVVSNCVINLSAEKQKVFSEIFRVLKPGGELYFSDVFADRRLPAHWLDDHTLVGECLAGALYFEDFRRMMQTLGVVDFRETSRSRITIENEEIAEKVGNVVFDSITVRAFKLASLEDRCEDYGQVAYYLGSLRGHPHTFALDDHHVFETGKPMLVCGNTAAMISETRFAPHFRLVGDRSVHFGLFPCEPVSNAGLDAASSCGC